MLLLHISDFHFRAPDCLDPSVDADRPFRTRLVQDVRALVAELGSVGAILIGGDIAFKGAPDEYKTALVWIRELAAVAGCPFERVFVIPGNHDLDRATISCGRRPPAMRRLPLCDQPRASGSYGRRSATPTLAERSSPLWRLITTSRSSSIAKSIYRTTYTGSRIFRSTRESRFAYTVSRRGFFLAPRAAACACRTAWSASRLAHAETSGLAAMRSRHARVNASAVRLPSAKRTTASVALSCSGRLVKMGPLPKLRRAVD